LSFFVTATCQHTDESIRLLLPNHTITTVS